MDILKLQAENEALKIENHNTKLRLDQYQQAYDQLQQQLKQLLRHRFGQRSERYLDPDHPQNDMFSVEREEAKQALSSDAEQDEYEEYTVRRHKKKSNDMSHYPRTIVIIPVADEDKQCSCGCEKTIIRYETKEMLHYKPAEYGVVEQRREVAACPKACEGSLITAPSPKHVLPKVKATEEFLAQVVVEKLHHRQPLYHLEKYRQMMSVTRETMARWVIDLMFALQPLYNLMKDEIIEYDVASIDATTLQVLKEPERKAELKSYVYCFRGGPANKSVILYEYNAKEHKTFVDNWFTGFQGSIHMDADPFFGALTSHDHVQASYCNSHARRSTPRSA